MRTKIKNEKRKRGRSNVARKNPTTMLDSFGIPAAHFWPPTIDLKSKSQAKRSSSSIEQTTISKQHEWRRNETGDYPPQRRYRYLSGALLHTFLHMASIGFKFKLAVLTPSRSLFVLLAPLSFLIAQGKAQLISNINACQVVSDAVRTTLGPRGMDKLVADGRKVTISNDGATIMKLLEIEHPAAKTLVDISMSQVRETRSISSVAAGLK